MAEPEANAPKGSRRRRLWAIALVVVVFAVGMFGRPVWHLITTVARDVDAVETLPPGHLDDASRLNATAISELWSIPVDIEEAEAQLAALLKRAATDDMPVAIAGSRHTMGGHTLAPDGIVIDMRPFDRMRLADDGVTLRVGSGATWAKVLAYVDPLGRSVAVMQSNNSFTVGGSISANCHGWQPNSAPIASTVESFRLMLADGSVRRCARDENAELFGAVLGGYGLFGVILDVELRTVANERYRIDARVLPADQLNNVYEDGIDRADDVGLVYARLNVDPEALFREGVICAFRRYEDAASHDLPLIAPVELAGLKRAVFRGSAGSDYGKRLRWSAETEMAAHSNGSIVTRNQLLSDPVSLYRDRTATTTDILHEYFVPHDHAPAFALAMGNIITAHGGDLLNVTIRDVRRDDDTLLAYARDDVFAMVLLFSQSRTEAGETQMRAMTVDLIDAALEHGGTYYLPYRLHATRAQFARAYPMSERFFGLKRKYDPDERFTNMLYQTYGVEPSQD